MGREHGRIFTSVWQDDDWLALTKDAQRLYMLLVTQPDLSFVGALPYRPGLWASWCANDSLEACALALDELREARFVLVDEVTMECLVRTFVKHDPGVLNSPNMIKAARKDWQAIYSDRLKAHVAYQVREAMFDRDGDKQEMVIKYFPEPWSAWMADGFKILSEDPSFKGSGRTSPKALGKGLAKGLAKGLQEGPHEGASEGVSEQSQSQSHSQPHCAGDPVDNSADSSSTVVEGQSQGQQWQQVGI